MGEKARPSVSEWECIRAQSSVHCCLSLYWRPCLESLEKDYPLELLYADDLVLVAETEHIVVQSLVINIGTCFASSYNVFRADDLSYGNVFRERSSRKTLP